jgi:hypothetical protein
MLKSPLTICKRPIASFKLHSFLATYNDTLQTFLFIVYAME